MGDMPYKILVVGLGNPILTDDGIGWQVAQLVRQRLNEHLEACPPTDIREACVGGLSLAELMVGYQRAIVVDVLGTHTDQAVGLIREGVGNRDVDRIPFNQ